MTKTQNHITRGETNTTLALAASGHRRNTNDILDKLILLNSGSVATLVSFTGVLLQAGKGDASYGFVAYASTCFLFSVAALLASKWFRSLSIRNRAYDAAYPDRTSSELLTVLRSSRQHLTWDGLMYFMDTEIKRGKKYKWFYTFPANGLILLGCSITCFSYGLIMVSVLGLLP